MTFAVTSRERGFPVVSRAFHVAATTEYLEADFQYPHVYDVLRQSYGINIVYFVRTSNNSYLER